MQEFYGESAEADDQPEEVSAAVPEAADETPAVATDDAGVIPPPAAEELPVAAAEDTAVDAVADAGGVAEAAG